ISSLEIADFGFLGQRRRPTGKGETDTQTGFAADVAQPGDGKGRDKSIPTSKTGGSFRRGQLQDRGGCGISIVAVRKGKSKCGGGFPVCRGSHNGYSPVNIVPQAI